MPFVGKLAVGDLVSNPYDYSRQVEEGHTTCGATVYIVVNIMGGNRVPCYFDGARQAVNQCPGCGAWLGPGHITQQVNVTREYVLSRDELDWLAQEG